MFQIQADYNLTASKVSNNKSSSPLGIIYFMRAHAYALDGNEKRAKQYFKEASKYGDKEIQRVATINTQRAERIMEADPELRKIKQANVQNHERIESAFERFIREVERVVKSVLDKLGKWR